MSGEVIFLLVTVVIVVVVVAVIELSKHRRRIKHYVVDRLNSLLEAMQRRTGDDVQSGKGSGSVSLNTEEQSKAELKRLQRVIDDRKQVASDSDISYHLWDLYISHFRTGGSQSLERYVQDGEWYDVNVLKTSSANGLNQFEFELKGDRFRFVDDEEAQGWSENLKYFSLFLYDDSDRCLIEIPMKVRVDRLGRNYSILSEGPRAFLPGDWISEFINVKLKRQSIRNREIREQKHKERLAEIEELKNRFGISD